MLGSPVTKVEPPTCEDDISVCVLSGLELGGEEDAGGSLTSAQLAVDWVGGRAGAPAEQSDVAGVERVIIAGDSLASSTRGKGYKAKYLTANAAAGSIAAVRQLDDLLVQLGNNYKQNIQIS